MSVAAAPESGPSGWGRVIGASLALFVFWVALAIAPLPAPGEPAADESKQATDMRTAMALIAANKWADALTPMKALADAYPANHIYAQHLAEIYQHLSQPAAEAAAWERFVATSPNAYEACPRIGEAYREIPELAKSIDAFERCLTFDPDNPDMQFFAARAKEWKDDWPAAEALYRKAFAADPRNVDVEFGLGRVALHAGRLDDARAHLERALAISDGYADLHYFMGLIEQRSGNAAAARQRFERALALSPSRPEFRAKLLEINKDNR
jgi:tetratricopeptide (TPR) repeat protein